MIKRFKERTKHLEDKISECNDISILDNITESIFDLESLEQVLNFFK
ncbi:MAG: hypothetical protein H7263_13275 [Candidatus Sericytochromatia bacterium]|nr:hypothetical protein [Candidatus Sericytochromatia bacterium]